MVGVGGTLDRETTREGTTERAGGTVVHTMSVIKRDRGELLWSCRACSRRFRMATTPAGRAAFKDVLDAGDEHAAHNWDHLDVIVAEQAEEPIEVAWLHNHGIAWP